MLDPKLVEWAKGVKPVVVSSIAFKLFGNCCGGQILEGWYGVTDTKTYQARPYNDQEKAAFILQLAAHDKSFGLATAMISEKQVYGIEMLEWAGFKPVCEAINTRYPDNHSVILYALAIKDPPKPIRMIPPAVPAPAPVKKLLKRKRLGLRRIV